MTRYFGHTEAVIIAPVTSGGVASKRKKPLKRRSGRALRRRPQSRDGSKRRRPIRRNLEQQITRETRIAGRPVFCFLLLCAVFLLTTCDPP